LDKYNEKYRFLSKMKNSKRENIIITSAYCLTVNRSFGLVSNFVNSSIGQDTSY